METNPNDVPGVTVCDHTKACCCTKCVPSMHASVQESRGRSNGYRNRTLGCGRPTLEAFRDERYGLAYLSGWDKADREISARRSVL